MIAFTEIMNMLDWNMPDEIQSKGRYLAKCTGTIIPFIQPVTPTHNKNVWKNCAIIIAEKNDDNLKPHLLELLEWLQDLNWPGALCIQARLEKYSDKKTINHAINICIIRARNCNDEIWERNLNILKNRGQGDGLWDKGTVCVNPNEKQQVKMRTTNNRNPSA